MRKRRGDGQWPDVRSFFFAAGHVAQAPLVVGALGNDNLVEGVSMVGIAANANHGHGAEVEAMLNGFAKEGARRIRSAVQVEKFCTEVAEWSFAFGDLVRACSGKWGVAPATAAPYSPVGKKRPQPPRP